MDVLYFSVVYDVFIVVFCVMKDVEDECECVGFVCIDVVECKVVFFVEFAWIRNA